MAAPADVSVSRRARSQRAALNDGVLSAAAHDLLVAVGWDSLTTRAIAAAARLSARPAYARFPDRITLAQTLWSERGAPTLRTELIPVIGSLLSSPPNLDTAEVRAHTMMKPSPNLIGCMELIGAAVYLPDLRAMIADDWQRELAAQCGIGPEASPTVAARGMYASAAILGLLMAQRDGARSPYRVTTVIPEIVESLSSPTQPRALPPDSASHMDYYPFETGDVRLNHLLEATLFEIADVGYHAATIERICQRAGVSQGFVFARYTTKLNIFVDATERRALKGLEVNLDFTTRLAGAHGTGIAEAVMWRESMRPEHQQARRWSIEQVRLAWHEPLLRQQLRDAEQAFLRQRHSDLDPSARDHAMASDLWGLALGMGMVMLAELFPEAWLLPYDVITAPASQL